MSRLTEDDPITRAAKLLGSSNFGPNDIARLYDLAVQQERLLARQAERDFSVAFAKMQPSLPIIDENGVIETTSGQDAARYATWEDTIESIRPILARHGFSLSFVPGRSPNGYPTVTGVLRHRGGHKETGELELPPDPTGGKNAVQAIGSALSYGQRYVARMLLSLTSRCADDNAQSATRGPAAFDAMAEIEAAPDIAALTKWKRRSRRRLAAMPARDQKAVVSRYLERRHRMAASLREVRP